MCLTKFFGSRRIIGLPDKNFPAEKAEPDINLKHIYKEKNRRKNVKISVFFIACTPEENHFRRVESTFLTEPDMPDSALYAAAGIV